MKMKGTKVSIALSFFQSELTGFVFWQKRVQNLKQIAFENISSWEICQEDHNIVPHNANLHLAQGFV